MQPSSRLLGTVLETSVAALLWSFLSHDIMSGPIALGKETHWCLGLPSNDILSGVAATMSAFAPCKCVDSHGRGGRDVWIVEDVPSPPVLL